MRRRPWWVSVLAANGSAGASAPVNGASSAFNPAQSAASVALTNGDRRATISVTAATGRSYCLAGKSSGNFYMEFVLVSLTTVSTPRFGIAPAGASLTTGVGFGATEWAITTNSAGSARILNNNTNSAFGDALAAGDIVGIAVNFSSQHIWFAKNNTWMASGDPAGDTNPAATISAATTYFPCISYAAVAGTPDIAVIDSPAVQNFAPPAGFTAWN